MSLMPPVIELQESPLFVVSDYISEKNQMCYCYVGEDPHTLDRLVNSFESGYAYTDLEQAADLIFKVYFESKRLPDVIFIDVCFREASFVQFCATLKTNILLGSLPLIYSEKQLTDIEIVKLNGSDKIDDIMKIDSPGINFFKKILFIKQSKLYNQLSEGTKKHKSLQQGVSHMFSGLMRRCIDVSIAGSCMVILSPLLLLIALAIRLESRGPIFYTALRAGKGFKVFKFYKFRSMVLNADKDVEKLSELNQYQTSDKGAVFFKINNDPRITRLGKLLRNTSIDELPQLLNVLMGDMSVVGNRPLPIYEAVSLTTNEFVERFSAPAGITGLWQVNKRGKADMSTEERINLDITYSRKCTVLYDLKILARTPVALFQKTDV